MGARTPAAGAETGGLRAALARGLGQASAEGGPVWGGRAALRFAVTAAAVREVCRALPDTQASSGQSPSLLVSPGRSRGVHLPGGVPGAAAVAPRGPDPGGRGALQGAATRHSPCAWSLPPETSLAAPWVSPAARRGGSLVRRATPAPRPGGARWIPARLCWCVKQRARRPRSPADSRGWRVWGRGGGRGAQSPAGFPAIRQHRVMGTEPSRARGSGRGFAFC